MRLSLSLFAGHHVAKSPWWTRAARLFCFQAVRRVTTKDAPPALRDFRRVTVSALFATCELDLRRRARNVKPRDKVAFGGKFMEHGAHGRGKMRLETMAKACGSSQSGFHPGLHCPVERNCTQPNLRRHGMADLRQRSRRNALLAAVPNRPRKRLKLESRVDISHRRPLRRHSRPEAKWI